MISLGQSLLGSLLAAGLAFSAPLVVDAESLLMSPLHMEELPPPLWCVRALSLGYGEGQARSREDASADLLLVLKNVEEGGSFRDQVVQYRRASGARGDGVLGVVPPGALAPSFEIFLERAKIGEVSGIIETAGALHLLERLVAHAAVRQLFLEGREESVRQRLLELRAEIVAGASFSELASEHSMDRASADRGGDYAVFERGSRDSQLKRAAFELEVGELSLPVETPLGWHLLQRMSKDSLSSQLVESNWARFRAVLITHAGSPKAANPERSRSEARALTDEIYALLVKGDPFEPIARFSNDDPGGKERAGDLGWVHRRMPGLPQYLQSSFLLKSGEVGAPFEMDGGWIVIQRTQ